jgi:isoleucyl-tRNA synthetase
MDYKKTLNLPKTAFPMKGNLAQREPMRLKQWNQADLYQQSKGSDQLDNQTQNRLQGAKNNNWLLLLLSS